MRSSQFSQILFFQSIRIAFFIGIGYTSLAAQKLKITEVKKPEAEGFNWEYIVIIGLGFALGALFFWWLNRRKDDLQPDNVPVTLKPPVPNKKGISQKKYSSGKSAEKKSSKTKIIENEFEPGYAEKKEDDIALPIFDITQIELTRPVFFLPLSNDESLLDAIEQASEESEEDEEIRNLALKILAVFKNQNSVEAISQIALYDLSAGLRSKAVSILADFDHESVFETILLACSDPSREVRAAAARGLFRLSFDRTEAWLRVGETKDIGRIRQAARAAIAGDFVERSIERLIHPDKKYANEAFAIIALLIKAGETEGIFEALNKYEEINIIRAILHIIKVTRNAAALEKLISSCEKNELPINARLEAEEFLNSDGIRKILRRENSAFIQS